MGLLRDDLISRCVPKAVVPFADLGQRPAMRLWRWVDGPGQRSLARLVRVKLPLDELVGDVDKIEALLEGVGQKVVPCLPRKDESEPIQANLDASMGFNDPGPEQAKG